MIGPRASLLFILLGRDIGQRKTGHKLQAVCLIPTLSETIVQHNKVNPETQFKPPRQLQIPLSGGSIIQDEQSLTLTPLPIPEDHENAAKTGQFINRLSFDPLLEDDDIPLDLGQAFQS